MKRNITKKDFALIFPEELKDKILMRSALSILRSQYCRRMVIGGKCTTKCNNCQPYLTDIFQRLLSSNDIRNYEAVFTWHLKNTVAKIKETKTIAPYKPPVDAFDRPIDTNQFIQFIQVMT